MYWVLTFDNLILYFTGLALEALAGVISLASSEMDQSKVKFWSLNLCSCCFTIIRIITSILGLIMNLKFNSLVLHLAEYLFYSLQFNTHLFYTSYQHTFVLAPISISYFSSILAGQYSEEWHSEAFWQYWEIWYVQLCFNLIQRGNYSCLFFW